MAGEYDFSIIRGDSFNARVKLVRNQAGVCSPINLSGYFVTGYLKYTECCPTTIGLSPIIYSYVSGYIDISLISSQTTGLPITKIPYYIKTYSGDFQETNLFGDFTINP